MTNIFGILFKKLQKTSLQARKNNLKKKNTLDFEKLN